MNILSKTHFSKHVVLVGQVTACAQNEDKKTYIQAIYPIGELALFLILFIENQAKSKLTNFPRDGFPGETQCPAD